MSDNWSISAIVLPCVQKSFVTVIIESTLHAPIVSTSEISISYIETIVLASIIILKVISSVILTLLTYHSAIYSNLFILPLLKLLRLLFILLENEPLIYC